MQFIEMLGGTLKRVVGDEDALSPDRLTEAGVDDQSIVRINRQGDIEIRRQNRWDVIGGLLGNFAARIRDEPGLDWA